MLALEFLPKCNRSNIYSIMLIFYIVIAQPLKYMIALERQKAVTVCVRPCLCLLIRP